MSLLAPIAVPYTEADSSDRARRLIEAWERAEASPVDAALLADACAASFWSFLAICVISYDEKAAERYTLRPAPPLECYKTLADFLDERAPDGTWAHDKVAVAKSRQLWITWFVAARLAWIAIHKSHGLCAIVSKTEDDSIEALRRVKAVLTHLPAWYRRERRLVVKGNAGQLSLSNGTLIEAMAQKGGDALRGRTPTACLIDEAVYHKDFEKQWQSLTGGQDARAQILVVSSAGPSWYERLFNDALDGKRGGPGEYYHRSQGLDIWRNRVNGLDCVRLHYTADPGRRSAEWKARKRAGVPRHQWQAEQEIDWAARGGQRVFEMLDREVHVMRSEMRVFEWAGSPTGWAMIVGGRNGLDGRPLVTPVVLGRGIDHGTNNYCAAVWVAIDTTDLDWFVYRVYKQRGRPAAANMKGIADASEWGRPLRKRDGSDGPPRIPYGLDVIDAMMSQQGDSRGKVEELYRQFVDGEGRKPFDRVETCKKGAGSRAEGLDRIASMLLATMAHRAPDNPYWAEHDYDDAWRDSFGRGSRIFIDPRCEALFEEMDAARYDERPGGDPTMAQPESTVDMMDDALDALRYLLRAGDGAGLYRSGLEPVSGEVLAGITAAR